MTLRNLHIIEDFLDSSEIEFWSHTLSQREWSQHPQPRSGWILSDTNFSGELHSAYETLVEKTCSTLETIWEDTLVISQDVSFRGYKSGDSIPWHYDYACDDEGEVLLLSDSNRRLGENSPCLSGFFDIQSVLYYNDDYSGGLVKFGEEEWMRPSAGMLITFPSTKWYGHAVSEITGGERYISSLFWIRAKTLAIASKTNLLPPQWRETFRWPDKVDTMLGRNLSEGQRLNLGITRVD